MTTHQSRLSDHARQSTGSYELMASAVLFGLAGLWLDRRLGITPALMITFTVLGFVGAFLSLYYRYRAQMKRLEDEAAEVRRDTEALRRPNGGAGAAANVEAAG